MNLNFKQLKIKMFLNLNQFSKNNVYLLKLYRKKNVFITRIKIKLLNETFKSSKISFVSYLKKVKLFIKF